MSINRFWIDTRWNT